MNNPLIEQACDCSTVRGGGGCKVRPCLFRGTRAESASHHDQPPGPAVWSALEPPWSSDCSSKLAADLQHGAMAHARCVLVSAAGTRW